MNRLRALLYLSIMLTLSVVHTQGAEKKDFPLGFDADNKFYFHRVNTFDNSLQVSLDAGWASYSTTLAQPELYRGIQTFDPATRQLIIGVMGEKNFFKAYFSVSAGISYMMFSTYMFGWPLSNGSGYVILPTDNGSVNYAQVNNVGTTTSYISIPIEAKYEFICEKRFGMYLKGALRTSINIGTRTYFEAQSGASDNTKKQLESFFKNDNPLFVNANGYLGLRFGNYDESNFRLELGIPIALTRDIANVHLTQGFGFRISYSLPLSIFVY